MTIKGRNSWVAGIVALSLCLLMLGGCSEEEEALGPEDVALSFLQELRMGERDAALERLWPETRQQLDEAYGALEEELGEDSPLERDRVIAMTRLESSMLIEGTEVEGNDVLEPEDGQQVNVILNLRDGRSSPVMVRWGEEESRWYVDLPLDERVSLHEGIEGVNTGQDEESERQ